MEAKGFRQFMPALALMAISTVWIAMLTLRPRADEPVAAFFSPFSGSETALRAASAADSTEILAFGKWQSIVLVRSADPELSRHLRAQGAWLVVRAPAISGCFLQGRA